MKVFSISSMKQAMIHIAAILCGYGLSILLSTEDNLTYGAISGWWLSLYIGFVFNVHWKAIAPFSILYIILIIFDISINAGWFYAEGASSDKFGYFLMSLIGLVMFLAPILINEVVRRFRK